MDIFETTNDFQDWELLHSSSDSDSSPVTADPFNEIDPSAGLIQANYFSLDAHDRHPDDFDDVKSAESDNPSWIDPGSEENPTRFIHKESGEFWSDSSSDRSDDRKFTEIDGKNEIRVDEIGEIEKGGKLGVESEDLGERCDLEKSGGGEEEKNGEIEKKRSVVWWKMPVEFLKYCVFRMSPVWAVSVAAAVMGFVILGRRLSKMKRKTRGLEIKVAVDDKKVSQVMSRAARLNEAFSIVKRVPVIRPSLPAVSSTNTWPVMSLR